MIFAAVQNLVKVTGEKKVKLSVYVRLQRLTESVLILSNRFQSEEDMRAVSKLANDYVNFCKECCLYASVSFQFLAAGVFLTNLGISKTYHAQNSCNTMRNTIAVFGHASHYSPYYTSQNRGLKMPPWVMS